MTLVPLVTRASLVVAMAVGALSSMGAACGPVSAKDAGAQLFADARFSGSDVNAFSCATCHAVGEGDAGRIYAGLPLTDAVARSRFWGGTSTSLLDATNACVVFFMRGQPITKEEPKARALYEYLASTTTDAVASQPALPMTIVENVTSLARGNPSRGSAVWDAACKTCHGDPHTGNGRITELASKVPEDSAAFAESVGFPLDLVVVEKVRHGAFFGVGGTMPPFPVEQLSDEDLGALIAFLGL